MPTYMPTLHSRLVIVEINRYVDVTKFQRIHNKIFLIVLVAVTKRVSVKLVFEIQVSLEASKEIMCKITHVSNLCK